MTDKPKSSDTDQAAQQPATQPSGPRSARRGNNDALDKDGQVRPEQLAENQKKLNVGPDHKTPDMKKGRRGTFP